MQWEHRPRPPACSLGVLNEPVPVEQGLDLMCTNAQHQDWLLISVPDHPFSVEDGFLKYVFSKIIYLIPSRLLDEAWRTHRISASHTVGGCRPHSQDFNPFCVIPEPLLPQSLRKSVLLACESVECPRHSGESCAMGGGMGSGGAKTCQSFCHPSFCTTRIY